MGDGDCEGTDDSEKGRSAIKELLDAMGKYNEELQKAGITCSG